MEPTNTAAWESVQAADMEVLSTAADWLRGGDRVALVTVIRTWGSSPRPPGSLLAMNGSGQFVGSVSGGCVEQELIARYRARELGEPFPTQVDFGVDRLEAGRLGLPCGGRMEILVQSLTAADCSWLETLLAAMEQRHCVVRQLNLTTHETTVSPVDHYHDLAIEGQQLSQCFGPRMRLLLVGAGQLAQSLAELALAMDYEVLVTDTRAQVLSQWEGPTVPLLQGMPDDIVREHASDRHCIIITLTHDPRIDDMALMEALGTEAWYVGALGSMRTTDKRLQRLRQLELPESQIARLHAPVGLDIGSKTPNEIAISIMAELTLLRRKGA